MRIGFIHPTPLDYTGGGVRVKYIARGLARRGHEVTVVNPRFRGFPSQRDEFELVEIRQVYDNKLLDIADFTIKAFKYLKGYDLIDLTCPLPNLAKLYRSPEVKFFYTVNELYGIRDYIEESRILFPLPYLTAKLNLKLHYDGIITVSNFSKRQVLSLGVDPRLVHVVYNGVDLEFYDSIEVREKYSKVTVTCVSRLSRKKRFDWLLKALYFLRKDLDAELMIVGTGPDERRLRGLTSSYGLTEHVRFMGRVSDEEKARILKRSHCFWFASRQEGFGLAPLEAMVCGLPVVVSDIPTMREVIGKAGIYARSPEEFASKTRELLSDPKLYEEFSLKARREAEAYPWEKTVSRIERVYEAT